MADTDHFVVENLIRLIKKARSMDRETAAVYIKPLLQLDNSLFCPKSANAFRAMSDLVDALRQPEGQANEIWEQVLSELNAWKSAID